MITHDELYELYLRLDAVFDEMSDVVYGNEEHEKLFDTFMDIFRKRQGYVFGCKHIGHYWLWDQCGRPEHRYCAFCDILYEKWEENEKQSNGQTEE